MSAQATTDPQTPTSAQVAVSLQAIRMASPTVVTVVMRAVTVVLAAIPVLLKEAVTPPGLMEGPSPTPAIAHQLQVHPTAPSAAVHPTPIQISERVLTTKVTVVQAPVLAMEVLADTETVEHPVDN